jgi:hypothetical protein
LVTVWFSCVVSLAVFDFSENVAEFGKGQCVLAGLDSERIYGRNAVKSDCCAIRAALVSCKVS